MEIFNCIRLEGLRCFRGLLAISTTIFLFTKGLARVKDQRLSYLWSLGFGSINDKTLMALDAPGSSAVIYTTLIANTPQLILTFLYFNYNSLFSCMLLGKEWSEYVVKRKTLRVSSPQGLQRGTYELQLPFRYGASLLAAAAILHWLVSQSIFLVRVVGLYNTGQESLHGSIATCGYSPIAILCVILLGATVLLFGIAFGFRRQDAVGW